MCNHWLCKTGSHGWCYFEPGQLGVGGGGECVNDSHWDELDQLHERVRQSAGNTGAAMALGKRIHEVLRWAMYADRTQGEQSRKELDARYGSASAPDPQGELPLRRAIVYAKHDAATAAAEIRRLGEDFARAVGEQLLK